METIRARGVPASTRAPGGDVRLGQYLTGRGGDHRAEIRRRGDDLSAHRDHRGKSRTSGGVQFEFAHGCLPGGKDDLAGMLVRRSLLPGVHMGFFPGMVMILFLEVRLLFLRSGMGMGRVFPVVIVGCFGRSASY